MPALSPAARARYRAEMAAAKTAADPALRWTHLERAHILSQPDPWLHTGNHVAMFALAVRQRDRREAFGQLVRILVAAPGSLTGRYPEGNTGRANVGLRRAMPIPADLAELLRPAG
ncbi:DUF3703 domain-containing protein [Nocardia farcinica]|uniref:DUF3703 domain-containing protein n=1 Tax=Nocardia farcinica TaxID=37329 RepID=UPI001895A2E5|nr:DUF3703 domain-containing protein [Nocardia farcinica]MBF6232207.1 DUF3703 domain-containing protein [Nocardia farcinica]